MFQNFPKPAFPVSSKEEFPEVFGGGDKQPHVFFPRGGRSRGLDPERQDWGRLLVHQVSDGHAGYSPNTTAYPLEKLIFKPTQTAFKMEKCGHGIIFSTPPLIKLNHDYHPTRPPRSVWGLREMKKRPTANVRAHKLEDHP